MAHSVVQGEDGRSHVIPLSQQVLTILGGIEHNASYSNFLFPSLRSAQRPMSDTTRLFTGWAMHKMK